MPMNVPCPGCGSNLKAPESMIGKKAKCKKCNTSFRIPGAAASDSVGESQALSVVAMPAVTDEDESIPMAAAVEETEDPPEQATDGNSAAAASDLPAVDPFDFSSPPVQKPAAPVKAKLNVSPPPPASATRPASAVAKNSPPPSASATKPASAVAKNSPPPSVSATKPASAAVKKSPPEPTAHSQPAASKAPSKPPPPAKQKATLPAKPTPVVPPPPVQKKAKQEENESDPFKTPFSPAPEAVTENDPFAFSAAPSAPAKSKADKQDQKEVVPEKPKPRGKQKSPPPADEPESLFDQESSGVPAASDDPFSFNPAPTSHGSKTRMSKQRIVEDEEEIDAIGGENEDGDEPSQRSGRRYGRRGEQKPNKLLFYAGVLGFVAIGAIIAALVVFFSPPKEPDQAKITTERKEEPVATPPPSVAPKGDAPKDKDDSITPKKDTGKKDSGKKDTGKKETAPREPKNASDPSSTQVAMLALPKDLARYTFRAPKDKPESKQDPSGMPIQVEAAFEKIKRFFPSPKRVENDSVVVWQSNPGFNGRGEKLTVDSYSSGTGSRVGRIEIDGDGKDVKCDLSTDAKVFAVAVDGKVSIWNLVEKKKILDGFDPYGDKPVHKKAGLAAVFIPTTPDKFVTVSTAGAIHLFDGSAKTIGEYIPEKGAPDRVVLGKNLAVEESHSSLVVSVGGAIHQVSMLDLQLVWKLPIGGEPGRSFGISVAGSPGRIAYAFETDSDKKKERAILFCLPGNTTPKIFRWQDSAGEPTSVNWIGTEFAVVGTTKGVVWFEYDTEGKNFTPLAMAVVPSDKGLHDATELAHWYLIPNPKDPAKSLMMAIVPPILGVEDFREQAAAKKPLETLRLDDKGLWR
ncbi:MAG TPA: hypothetical protein VG097_19010 [Gemmata sp.]|nr:hypothetical protein [Gemmata sp.]